VDTPWKTLRVYHRLPTGRRLFTRLGARSQQLPARPLADV